MCFTHGVLQLNLTKAMSVTVGTFPVIGCRIGSLFVAGCHALRSGSFYLARLFHTFLFAVVVRVGVLRRWCFGIRRFAFRWRCRLRFGHGLAIDWPAIPLLGPLLWRWSFLPSFLLYGREAWLCHGAACGSGLLLLLPLLLMQTDTLSYLPQSRVSVEVVSPDAHDSPFTLASFDPLRPYYGNVHFDRLLPRLPSTFRADEVGSVNPHCVYDLGADPLDGGREAVFQRCRENAGGDGDSRQVGHLMRPNGQLLAAVCACGCPQDEMKRVFGVDCQSADLRALDFRRARYTAGLAAIPV